MTKLKKLKWKNNYLNKKLINIKIKYNIKKNLHFYQTEI